MIFARGCHAAADVMADLSVDPITGQSDPPLHEEVTSSNAGRPWPHAVSKGRRWEWSQLTSLISSASHHLGHTNLRIMINQDVTVPVAFLLYTFRHIPHAGDTNEALNISSQQLEHHTWLERSNNALPDDQRQPGLESESRSHSKRNP